MDRNTSTTFSSVLHDWIKKSRQEEIAEQNLLDVYNMYNPLIHKRMKTEERKEAENSIYKYNLSIKKRKEVLFAYAEYTNSVSEEIADIALKELRKKLVEFFSCACHDQRITDKYGEYFSIYYNQLLINIKKIQFKDFDPNHEANKEYADKTWTVIEYTANIVKRHYNKAIEAEIIKNHTLTENKTDDTLIKHQKIALKAKEICAKQGWNESVFSLSDEKLEYIISELKDIFPNSKTPKKIRKLKDIMINYELNIVNSYDQILGISVEGEDNADNYGDSDNENKLPSYDPSADESDNCPRLHEVLKWIVDNKSDTQSNTPGDNKKKLTELQVEKFALHILYKCFKDMHMDNTKMRLDLTDSVKSIGFVYSCLLHDYPWFFKEEYYTALHDIAMDQNKFPTEAEYYDKYGGYTSPNVHKGYKSIINSELFFQRFGKQAR